MQGKNGETCAIRSTLVCWRLETTSCAFSCSLLRLSICRMRAPSMTRRVEIGHNACESDRAKELVVNIDVNTLVRVLLPARFELAIGSANTPSGP